MITSKPLEKGPILGLVLVFFAVCTWTSYARWADFEYRTFDLAYYVQALWQLIHGRFAVSVEGVPLLGNHVEPIVVLIAPFFLVVRHPMLFVVLQNLALALMGPVAFDVAKRLGLDRKASLLLAAALLLAPAAGFIALHEFHPEALTAPFLLFMLRARLQQSLCGHWTWMIALLACKENMALLVAAYCVVHLVLERKRKAAELRAWYLWPLVVSVCWFFVCTKIITPALNPGDIDYLALYDRLGASAGEIFSNAVTQPCRILSALFASLSQGNLLWALLFPFLGLPLLRPRWLLIAVPILLQHLLSWRSSEWTIYFHYAAPLLPLFWIALAEGVAGIERFPKTPNVVRLSVPWLVLMACVTSQFLLGPAGEIAATTAGWFREKENRARKEAFLREIPDDASLLAPLPYLSHLAMREKLYSLHYVLKGLKTLSRANYEPPPPTDFVLVDYEDSATFDPAAGYYHPAMKTVNESVIPSSDQLLHQFLTRASWTVTSSDELTLLRREKSADRLPQPAPAPDKVIEIGTQTRLLRIAKSSGTLADEGLEIEMSWSFQEPRDVFPWMFLKLTPRDRAGSIFLSRGLCAIEVARGSYEEKWLIHRSGRIPAGAYSVEAIFLENAKRFWPAKPGQRETQSPLLCPPIPLGELQVPPGPGN
ncbi:MAG: hypothetical protein DLM73_08065 [Chthoniobacterales bacterium]|nr:MAG: hypothetical protein DLM73_08065 [Chthoniobacterales bacterium]